MKAKVSEQTEGEEDRRLLTARQASQRWNLPVKSLYDWSARGIMPHLRIGTRAIRFPVAAVDAWIAQQTAGPRDAA